MPLESGSAGVRSIHNRLPATFGRGSTFLMEGNEVLLEMAAHAACLLEFC